MIHIKIESVDDTTICITGYSDKESVNVLVKIPSFKRSGMSKFRELLQTISYEITLLLKEIEK